MAITNLFSKRQKQLRGDMPDVYVYDSLPEALRIQIIHIWTSALGGAGNYYNNVEAAYRYIVETLCREYGVFSLMNSNNYGGRNYFQELSEFLLREEDVERALDAVEFSFDLIDNYTRRWEYLGRQDFDSVADDAIDELNARFKEHGVGFRYESGEIIRVDSELIHSDVVKPALRLLNQKEFAGAQQEFLKAHEHYRHGNTKEALNECLKAFESLMKTICDKRGWTYDKNATAKNLIDICFENKLIPIFWQNNFASLRNLLEGGVPTGRNKLSGHGQGSETTTVPDHLAAYMLHMTAASLVFLGEADAALP